MDVLMAHRPTLDGDGAFCGAGECTPKSRQILESCTWATLVDLSSDLYSYFGLLCMQGRCQMPEWIQALYSNAGSLCWQSLSFWNKNYSSLQQFKLITCLAGAAACVCTVISIGVSMKKVKGGEAGIPTARG